MCPVKILNSVNAQAVLNVHWVLISEGTFSDVAAQLTVWAQLFKASLA